MNRILWHRIQIGIALLAAFATGVGVTYSLFARHRAIVAELDAAQSRQLQELQNRQLVTPMALPTPEASPNVSSLHSIPADPSSVINSLNVPPAVLEETQAKMDAQRCDTDTGRGCVWVNTATGVYYPSNPNLDKDTPKDGWRMTSVPAADEEGYTSSTIRSGR